MPTWFLPVFFAGFGIALTMTWFVYPLPALLLLVCVVSLNLFAALSLWLVLRRLAQLNEHVDAQTEALQVHVKDLEKANRSLEQQAERDYLTGLYHRQAFTQRLEIVLTKARRLGFKVAVLFLNLTGFKHINHSLGYASGDLLLQQVAQHLLKLCHDEFELAGHLSGDKFVILLRCFSEESAILRVQGLFDLFTHTPLNIGERSVPVKLSIGINLATAGDSAEKLIQGAESAMQHAKQKSGNAYAVERQAARLGTIDRLALENELYNTLTQHPEHIKVFFQPKRHIHKNLYSNPESLVRWQHPQRGFISPGEFIPLAEETGLIIQLGELVLRKACTEAMNWRNPLQVAVNFSPRQFMEPDIVERVQCILQETGLPPQRLIMEITESMVMPESNDKLRQFVDLGIQLSIDDFGTGYSNLKSLQKSLITELKIDRSFVLDMVHNPQSQALVEGILCLAHKLKLRVVAEGVENIEQVSLLRQFKCDYIQGFLFCKPLPSERFAQLTFVNQIL